MLKNCLNNQIMNSIYIFIKLFDNFKNIIRPNDEHDNAAADGVMLTKALNINFKSPMEFLVNNY